MSTVHCVFLIQRKQHRICIRNFGERAYIICQRLCIRFTGKQVLTEIRKRLDAKKTVHCLSTSLVEAGVDLDFQTVYRQLAGVDSVIQAAGRCNREGKAKPG